MSTGGHSPAGMLGVGAGVTLVVMLCRSYEHSAGMGRQPAAPCRVVGSRLAAAQHDDGLPLRDILLPRLRSTGTGSRRCRSLRALQGSLPRHGENAWLRGAYRVGRGDAMTTGWPLRAAGSHAEPLSPLRWSHDAQHDTEPLRRDIPSAATSLGAYRCTSCATCATRQHWHSAGATGHSRPRPANMTHLRRRVVA
jgi:hypothetical protein